MKITFKVTLDTDNIDEKLDLNCLIKSKDMAIALWEISHNNKNLDRDKLIDKINYTLENNGINLAELTY